METFKLNHPHSSKIVFCKEILHLDWLKNEVKMLIYLEGKVGRQTDSLSLKWGTSMGSSDEGLHFIFWYLTTLSNLWGCKDKSI